MKLKKLVIELQPAYCDNAGKYEGEIQYEQEKGKTTIVLDQELSEKMLLFIGPIITAAATKVAKELEANLKSSVEEAQKHKLVELSQ